MRTFKFIAEAVNKEAGQGPMTFVLEECPGDGADEGTPFTTGFDLGDTDYGKGLKVFSRATDLTDGSDDAREAAFVAHLALFEHLNLKYAERLGKLRDDAKTGGLWRTHPVAEPAPPGPPPPAPPPPLTASTLPQSGGSRRPPRIP